MAKAQAQEPSMEEILASIRRIIADEETAPKGAAPAPAPAPAEDETISEEDLDKLFASADADEPAEEDEDDDDDVLDLTEELTETVALDGPPLVEGLGDDADIAFADEPEPEPEPAPAPAPEPVRVIAPEPPRAPPRPEPKPEPVFVAPPRMPEPMPRPVIAAEVPMDVSPLLSGTTEGLVSHAFNDLALTVLNRNARTLEDLVQDMLRPMLKTWLDQNLPGMVERMVRAEIERVTRGR